MARYKRHLIYIIAFAIAACSRPQAIPSADTLTRHAAFLRLYDRAHGVTCVELVDPACPTALLARYLLVPDSVKVPDIDESALPQWVVLRTPLQRLAVTSACHLYLLTEFGCLDRVAAVADSQYVMAEVVRRALSRRPALTSIGSSVALNAEALWAAQCDALWVSPQAASHLGQVSCPVVYNAEYLERTPLGQAEWMRFYGRLVGCATTADSLFAAVEQRYEAARERVRDISPRPMLLAERPWGTTWYVPGGESTAAHLYADAGYRYLFADDAHTGGIPLSLEHVMARAAEVDCWLFKYYDPAQRQLTRVSLLQDNPAFASFTAYQTGEVYACNTAFSDFFDVTPFRPDTLLESLLSHRSDFFYRLPE